MTRAIMPPQGRATERARTLLRQLAELEPSDVPVLSASLDLRPQADAANPGSRETRIVLRDRLREELDRLPPHEPAHDSLSADAERLTALLDERAAPNEPEGAAAPRGLLAWACNAKGLWETYLTQALVENRVTITARPALLPLAQQAAFQPAVVALFDTNTLRLFAARPGRLLEIAGIDDPSDNYTQSGEGGWSQGRYERHVDEHREAFARRMAERMTALMEREGNARLVLCGDEVAVTTLQSVLPGTLADDVAGTLPLEVRATLEEIEEQVLPLLAALAEERTIDAADRLVGAARGEGMGVGGLDETRRMLEVGAALEVLIDDAILEEEAAEELIRLAALTDAPVTFARGHEGLVSLGGVGALLRFKP